MIISYITTVYEISKICEACEPTSAQLFQFQKENESEEQDFSYASS